MRQLAAACMGLALAITLACSGGPGTTSARVGTDPPPTSGDQPISSSELPQTSESGCFACARWLCATGKGSFEVNFTNKNGGCYRDDHKIDTCHSTSISAQGVSETFSPRGTNLRVCYSINPTANVCLDCVQISKDAG